MESHRWSEQGTKELGLADESARNSQQIAGKKVKVVPTCTMCSVKLSMNAYTALRMSAVRIGPECTVAFDYQWALFELKSKCPTAAMPNITYKDRGTNTWVRDKS